MQYNDTESDSDSVNSEEDNDLFFKNISETTFKWADKI